jgi:2-polyprenyl-3-methyl-5-hydroxy-6-metoxy-1,4-benzoquinol methylase
MATATKDPGYYANTRADVVALLERPLGAVLDVGCGSGGVGPGLRAAGAGRLVGIEFDGSAAERARAVYDRVETGSVETALAELNERFDTVLCLDVLEHLVDPGDVLARLHEVASDGARIAVSVPNVRHYSTFTDLIARGTFRYAEAGLHDSTHLRWFTRRDMLRELEAAGWHVERTSHLDVERFRWAWRLSPRRLGEFLVSQWYFFARATPGGAP